ncbi:hypothetical protein CWU58_23450 [Salmonella enterica]|uniref:Uncharacterized protein n=1 Tax=Salmonella enterica TaxID=28901 RepID=A0A744IWF8_SALER|nr:hypothetical protein [Salmonella enterica]HAF2529862.1 hypothetical protein [Salmonella enterica]
MKTGEAVSAYNISENFGITIKQSRAFMTVLENDSAIKIQRGANEPTSTACGYEIRILKVTAIDREKLASRKKIRVPPTTTTTPLNPSVTCPMPKNGS